MQNLRALGRIRTEILKKGQEPIRTKFHFFLEKLDPISEPKSFFQDKRHISDRATVILEKKFEKKLLDMEVRTIIFGKSRGDQAQSGQISRASVRTNGAFSGSGLPYHYPGSSKTQGSDVGFSLSFCPGLGELLSNLRGFEAFDMFLRIVHYYFRAGFLFIYFIHIGFGPWNEALWADFTSSN